MKNVNKSLLYAPVCRALFAALLCSGTWLQAQTAPSVTALPAAMAATASPRFTVSGFEIKGMNPLPERDVQALLAPYVGTSATLESLQQAVQVFEAELRARGYALHRVALPPQELGGRVALNVVKFVIGKVAIDGRLAYTAENIRSSLPELAEDSAPNFRTLAVQTAIANESPGKQVQVVLKESEVAQKIDARILVKEAKPWYVTASASNTGSAATGEDRVTLAAGHANVWDRDHQITLAYTTSAARTKDVTQFGLDYRAPLYAWGGVLAASYTQSDVVGEFGAFRSTGAGQTMGLNYSHYLLPNGGFRSYVTVGLEEKQFNVTKINGVALAGQVQRRSLPLSLGYNARVESDASTLAYGADVALNMPGGVGNDLSAYRTEDTRITTANWSALHGNAQYAAPLSGGWLWGTRVKFQYSGDALIAGEQFGLGGAGSVRGTGERVLVGDSGALVSLELTSKELLPGLRALGFGDMGWLQNNNPNASKPASDRLASVGFGLRYVRPSVAVSAEYGRLVTGSSMPAATGLAVPRSGDDKLHVNLTARF